MEMSEIAPLPRLCVLVKNATGDEFGFNLVGRNDSSEGRYIGQVDANGIAEAAGLLQGDEIITVNGKDVTSWSHTQVVNEIKTNPLTTQLLVISQKGYEWYQQRHMAVPTVIPSDKQICIIESALPNDSGLSDMNDTIGDSSEIEEKTVSLETDRTESESNTMVEKSESSTDSIQVQSLTLSLDEGLTLDDSSQTAKPEIPENNEEKPESNTSADLDLDVFRLSAAEMKAKLIANRRVDSRKFQQMPIKEKMNILKTL